MDQGLWQTIISFDLLHSSYMWRQTVLPCRKHYETMQTGTVSRLRFCGRPRRFKIHFWRNIVRFWKSYICSNQLDVSETNFCFAQVQQNQKSFSWTQDWGWMVYPHLIYGIWSSQFFTETRIRAIKNGEDLCMNQREVRAVPHTLQKRKKSHGMIDDLDNVDFISSNVDSSRQEGFVVCVWRQPSLSSRWS